MKTNHVSILRTAVKSVAACALTLSLSVGAFADRLYWDFTKPLSASTTENLKSDSYWKDSGETKAEADGTPRAWTNATKLVAGPIMANGVVLPELEGIEMTTNGISSAADIRIGVQTDGLLAGMMGEGSSLWPGLSLNDNLSRFRLIRANMSFKFASLKAGDKVEVAFMSAKPWGNPGDTGRCLESDQMTAISGFPGSGTPAEYYANKFYLVTFEVKSEYTEPTDIYLRSTAGVDIFWISINGNMGGGSTVEAKNVAYVTNSTASAGFDEIQTILEGYSDRVSVTPLESTEALSLEQLQGYDAVVVSPFVGAEDAAVAALKSAVAYQPMVNFSAPLYAAWGLGTATETEALNVDVTEKYAAHDLFAGLTVSELALLNGGGFATVEPNAYFAEDEVVATVEGKTAIHIHNAFRNAYVGAPIPAASVINPDQFGLLAVNAACYAAGTKKVVTPATAPAISQANGNLETVVTITSAPGSVVYYTTDGSEPTTSSAVYTEPFTLKEAATVKAFATLDGYLPSGVTSLDVIIKSKAATPYFTLTRDENSTTIEISTSTPDVDIYYNYNGIDVAAKSGKYTEPIVLKDEPATIYAFAAGGDYVDSDLASTYVSIKSITAQTLRNDTVSHFSACEAAWMPAEPAEGSTGAAKAHYYWGKKAWNYYSTEVDHYETQKDENGNDVEVAVYKPDPAAIRTIEANEGNGTENDWRLFSQGQVLTGELTLAAENGVGNGATGRFHETAEDLIGGPASKGVITFGGKADYEPYTGAVESIKKFKAPFDVVTYLGQGAGNDAAITMVLQISDDQEKWDTVDTLAIAKTQRYIKKQRVHIDQEGEHYVRVAHKGGKTKAQLCDIYIFNNGPVSQAYDPESGIQDVIAPNAGEVVSTEYFNLNGVRVANPAEGLYITRTRYANGIVKVAKVIR